MNWADATISNHVNFKEDISSRREREVGLAGGAEGISNFWEGLYSVGLRVLFCLCLIFIFPCTAPVLCSCAFPLPRVFISAALTVHRPDT